MAKPNIYHQVDVTCISLKYPVYIGQHFLLSSAKSLHALLIPHVKGSQVLVVTNETIAPLYLATLKEAFIDLQCDTVILPDGEMHKNQQNLDKIYDALMKHHHHRDTTLIALGGGVIGDMTGFAASTYQRGVAFIQIPTTLLAQVDASIGGKTAINHPLGKNMIGSFYQPEAVLIDLDTLTTLPEREFRAGFAEVIKYAFLEGGEFFQAVRQAIASDCLSIKTSQLADLVAHCCRIKAAIVEKDEKETGVRALLNLGHTFAHALEAYTQYQRWLHGEAVAIGLYCAASLSYQLGYLNKSDLALAEAMICGAKLPHRIPEDINLSKLQTLMLSDKKIKNQTLHFVLMKGFGDCYLDSTVTEKDLNHLLMSATEGGHGE
jgi:3-dehydroquinate synthase